jgi:hypothetical protein
MRTNLAIALVLALVGSGVFAADEERKPLWEGTVHLGDNAAQFASVLSAGMSLQIPCKLDSEKKGKLLITTRDIQTLAGDGHYAELVAYYQDDDGPAREYLVEAFRLKENSNNADQNFSFDFEPLKNLYAKPAFYAVRIKVDTQIKYGLWDDFLLKRIEVEQ